jgi:hypothetical protein
VVPENFVTTTEAQMQEKATDEEELRVATGKKGST